MDREYNNCYNHPIVDHPMTKENHFLESPESDKCWAPHFGNRPYLFHLPVARVFLGNLQHFYQELMWFQGAVSYNLGR